MNVPFTCQFTKCKLRIRVFQKNPTSSEMLARTSKYLTPTRTHFISVELLNPFWLKNDGEKGSRKNYFKKKTPAQKG